MHPRADTDPEVGHPRHAVVWLNHPAATNDDLAGAKAANLARATAAGLPVLPGFVVTTVGTAAGRVDESVERAVVAAGSTLAGDEAALVVRSSSTIEDAGASSMAGRFTSVLDVRGPDALLAALRAVIDSAQRVHDANGAVRPIAVLVQCQLDTGLSGVMFGVDPVTGRDDHLVVEVVHSGPDALVSGRASAAHFVLTRRGRVVQHISPVGAPSTTLHRHLRHELVTLAERVAATFGGPQDVEWAVDRQGTLHLLQSRPVTGVRAAPGHDGEDAPVLGPGPLAETFPAPLAPLEADLWLAPMSTGMRRALIATGAARRSTIDRSPVITCVRGRPAVDLALIGAISATGRWQRLAPRALARRLTMAWRVGRLRAALPSLAAAVACTVDDDLSAIGALTELNDAELITLLRGTRSELATVHAFEMLCGMIERHATGAMHVPLPVVAMRAVSRLRAAGFDDEAIVQLAPESLALTVPSIGTPPVIPVVGRADVPGDETIETRSLTDRDELRLRIRWLQELGARVATELGRRASHAGALDDPLHVRWVGLDGVERLGSLRLSGEDAAACAGELSADQLPVRFRLVGNAVQPLTHARRFRRRRGRAAIRGLPASSGRVVGTVVHTLSASDQPAPTAVVLVTDHLDPTLASALPSIAGLVAETGSALSHLAILAREAHLPTVVAVPEARRRLPCGTRILVDGSSGDVEVLDEPVNDRDRQR